MRVQTSTGERLVWCTRVDCAFAGDAVEMSMSPFVGEDGAGQQLYVCEAEIIVLDRRVKFGKVCARFAKKA